MMVMAFLIGGGSLILFGIFLATGPMAIVRLHASDYQVLLWDGLLSILFFIQHSGMVRTSFRTRLAPVIPRHYHLATYAIASGMALTAVVLLWQPSPTVMYQGEGLLRLVTRAISLLAITGLAWGAGTLRSFDPFGLNPIRAYVRGRQLEAPEFIVRGPYRWVRHPLYFFILVLIWSAPDVSLDRLLFNMLWTLWIVLGAYLEEKDLVAEFGEKYRNYQQEVPMLFPWRFPRGFKL
jgi:protein-S-isoprenylcysteine O-methyltransferase Ste14